MNWSKDSLLSKAKIYFEKATSEERDSLFFGMYCALGLELLARASLAKISPALLADSTSTENLLYALNLKDVGGKQKSIMTNKVFQLCGELIPDFNKDMQHIATLMTERRNEDLHTGGGGFAEYNIDNWIAGFYQACQVLGSSLGESLETLFGREVANDAKNIILQDAEKIKKAVLDRISARKKTYEEDVLSRPNEIKSIISHTETEIREKTCRGYHKVSCPCCGNDALVYGKETMSGHDTIEGDTVVVRKEVTASTFQCNVCKLRLSSYAELKCAGVLLHYTNTYYYDPTEYFDIDVDFFNEDTHVIEEYSNE